MAGNSLFNIELDLLFSKYGLWLKNQTRAVNLIGDAGVPVVLNPLGHSTYLEADALCFLSGSLNAGECRPYVPAGGK